MRTNADQDQPFIMAFLDAFFICLGVRQIGYRDGARFGNFRRGAAAKLAIRSACSVA